MSAAPTGTIRAASLGAEVSPASGPVAGTKQTTAQTPCFHGQDPDQSSQARTGPAARGHEALTALGAPGGAGCADRAQRRAGPGPSSSSTPRGSRTATHVPARGPDRASRPDVHEVREGIANVSRGHPHSRAVRGKEARPPPHHHGECHRCRINGPGESLARSPDACLICSRPARLGISPAERGDLLGQRAASRSV